MENKLQHQYHNVKAFSEQNKPFKPARQDEPKCYNIFLNSQNKVSGTNSDCSFNIKLPDDFTSDRLGVCMTNFIPSYPTGTDEGIVQVNLAGLDNMFSYSSSNQNTHKVLGMFPLNDGLNKMYPPANMTGSNINTFSNLQYGNGTYIASGPNRDAPFQMFDGNSNTVAAYWGGAYGTHPAASNNVNGGAYNQSISTTMSGSNYLGATWNIQLPEKIVPQSYTLQHSNDTNKMLTSWAMGGSSNGTSWELLDFVAQSNVPGFTIRNRSINTSNAYDYYRIVGLTVGWSTASTVNRDIPQIAEWRIYGNKNPQVLSGMTSKVGQVNLNNEIITCDNSLFKRETRVTLTSPTGLDLSTMCNWSMSLNIYENPN